MEDIKEKSADEMFEELGYIKDANFNSISYDKEYKDYFYTIVFDIKNKTFYKCSNCNQNTINIQELKAINKKIEELGW